LSLRERQRRERCERVLAAAETLIRETGGTEFPMVLLAVRAEMSETTPYNLFGSKGGILYALANRAMQQNAPGRQSVAAASDPIERIVRSAEVSADLLADDPRFFRPLWRCLLGVHDPVHRPAILDRSLEWWRSSLRAAEEAGLLSGVIDAEEMARELVIHALGVMGLWVQGELDDEEFRAQFVFGTALMVLPFAEGVSRERVLARMRRIKRRLPRPFSFSAAVARAAPANAVGGTKTPSR
jgi:AcrR family transcriptional regulator